jgi:hypothetical protein
MLTSGANQLPSCAASSNTQSALRGQASLPPINQLLLDIAWVKVVRSHQGTEERVQELLKKGQITQLQCDKRMADLEESILHSDKAKIGEKGTVKSGATMAGVPGWYVWHKGITMTAVDFFNAVSTTGGYYAVCFHALDGF